MPAAFVSSQLLLLFVLSPHRSAPRVCECDRLACFGPRVSCLLSVCAAFVAFSVCLRLRASSIAALRSSVSLWQAAYHTYFRRAARTLTALLQFKEITFAQPQWICHHRRHHPRYPGTRQVVQHHLQLQRARVWGTVTTRARVGYVPSSRNWHATTGL